MTEKEGTGTPEAEGAELVITPGGGHTFDDLSEGLDEPRGEDGVEEEKEGSSETPGTDGDEAEAEEPKEEEPPPSEEKQIAEKITSKLKGGRVIKAKAGDEEVELSTGLVITHPVSGHPEEVTVEELLSNWSGKTDLSRKYAALDKDKKSHQQEKEAVNNKLSELAALVKGGNSYATLEYLCEMAGQDKETYLKQYLAELEKHAEEYSSMTPEQRELLITKKRAQALEAEKESTQTVLKTQAREREVQDFFVNILAESSVAKEEFSTVYEDLKKSGIFEKYPDATEEQTIEGVVGEVVYRKHKNRVLGLVEKHTPKLLKEEEVLVTLLDMVDSEDPDEKIISILSEVGEAVGSTDQAEEETPTKDASPRRAPNSGKPKSQAAKPESAPSESEEEVIADGIYAGRELEDTLELDT